MVLPHSGELIIKGLNECLTEAYSHQWAMAFHFHYCFANFSLSIDSNSRTWQETRREREVRWHAAKVPHKNWTGMLLYSVVCTVTTQPAACFPLADSSTCIIISLLQHQLLVNSNCAVMDFKRAYTILLFLMFWPLNSKVIGLTTAFEAWRSSKRFVHTFMYWNITQSLSITDFQVLMIQHFCKAQIKATSFVHKHH